MRLKRAPLKGVIGIILIIGLLISTHIVMVNLKQENTRLIKENNSLNETIKTQLSTIETLQQEQIEMKEKILELEQKLKSNHISYTPYISRDDKDPTSRSYAERKKLEDRETLARLVFLESNTESLECQKAVASVIINRLNSGQWGDTLESVIYARGQFTPASKIPHTTPTDKNYEAVDYVLTNGPTLPSYCLYFRTGHHFPWQGYKPYTSIDNTYFGYLEKDMK
jgi:hypothetical protein